MRLLLFSLLVLLTMVACQPTPPQAAPTPTAVPTPAQRQLQAIPSGANALHTDSVAVPVDPWAVCEPGIGVCVEPREDLSAATVCEPAAGVCLEPRQTGPTTMPHGVPPVLREAYRALLDRYVDPLAPGAVLQAALDATIEEVRRRRAAPPTLTPAPFQGDRDADWELFAERYQTLATLVPDGGPDQLAHVAIRGMAASVNEGHTSFLSPRIYQEQLAWLIGYLRYGGIGIRLSGSPATIYEVYPNSPAQRAGLQYGDEIAGMEGRPTGDTPIDQIVAAIRGPAGTPIQLTVRRPDGTTYDATIRREAIDIPFVESRVLDGKVGYIRVRGFPATSVANQVEQALKDFRTQSVEGLVLDLRGNSGGLIDAGTQTLGLFMADQRAYVEVTRDGRRTVRTVRGEVQTGGLPLAVLVDRATASMGEVFAAAIQENRIGRVVGTTTAGNVAAAQAFALSDGSAIQVTVYRLETATGKPINKIGVRPDEVVERTPADARAGRDPQLDAAVTYLQIRGKPRDVVPSPSGATSRLRSWRPAAAAGGDWDRLLRSHPRAASIGRGRSSGSSRRRREPLSG